MFREFLSEPAAGPLHPCVTVVTPAAPPPSPAIESCPYNLIIHLNGDLPVVGHSGDLFLHRVELFMDGSRCVLPAPRVPKKMGWRAGGRSRGLVLLAYSGGLASTVGERGQLPVFASGPQSPTQTCLIISTSEHRFAGSLIY